MTPGSGPGRCDRVQVDELGACLTNGCPRDGAHAILLESRPAGTFTLRWSARDRGPAAATARSDRRRGPCWMRCWPRRRVGRCIRLSGFELRHERVPAAPQLRPVGSSASPTMKAFHPQNGSPPPQWLEGRLAGGMGHNGGRSLSDSRSPAAAMSQTGSILHRSRVT